MDDSYDQLLIEATDYMRALNSVRTRAWLLEGCMVREMERGNKSLDILNAMEHLEYIKQRLEDVGLEW